MAHVAKYTKNAMGHMLEHYEHKHKRDNIDPTRTEQNYNLAKDIQPQKPIDFIHERLEFVKVQNRKDINYICDWVVTLPKDVKPEDEDKFFKAAFDFMARRYKQNNIVSAWVHKDEASPHIHFCFLPIVPNNSKSTRGQNIYPEKLSAKNVLTRNDLQTFHIKFNEHIKNVLGYEVSLLNEATKNGNRTVTELKRQTELQKQKEYIDQTQKIVTQCNRKTSKTLQDLKDIFDQVQGYKALKATLEGKIEDLQNLNNQTMEQIADLASKSGLYNDLLERNILAGNYQDVEDLRNAIYDAQEAQEVLNYTQGIDIYQNDPSL